MTFRAASDRKNLLSPGGHFNAVKVFGLDEILWPVELHSWIKG
jgi:hypothetical protein